MKKLLLLPLLLVATPVLAGEIPKSGLVCLQRSQLEEAHRAALRNDTKWLGSIRGCFGAAAPLRAERIECDGAVCKARVFDGGNSLVAYTWRRYL